MLGGSDASPVSSIPPDGPSVGVLLLDKSSYAADEYALPSDRKGRPDRPPGFLQHPATWGMRSIFRVARGATGDATALQTTAAREGMRQAAEALDGRVDVITTNCAYTSFMSSVFDGIRTPVMAGGVDLLDHALRLTQRSVALVVSDSVIVQRLMVQSVPRVRLVELEGEPEWHRFADGASSRDGLLSQARMAAELRCRLQRDIEQNDVPGAVVLECSGLPQFRSLVQHVYGHVPVFDLVTSIHALFGLAPPAIGEWPT